ncbi:MAG: RnfH family protein [Oceanospirillaceae bacterium]|nr:RnfH family protein [Oceanospirillaceae bacterium]MBT4443953.1 RnfH family protein [Oceanospirillaceae bacterium]MBT6077482.1 RnfH family protein [Oceanospirillaceae bacterium]MBT7329660.1 RnfH family protein [Oceanospirillaceae bacterium]
MRFVNVPILFISEKHMIDVEVAFALPDQQKIIALQVPIGTSVFDAAVMSGISSHFEGLQLEGTPMGIFGKAVKNPQAEEIKQGQRVEIYRPLTIDPKVARANRAAKAAAKAKIK